MKLNVHVVTTLCSGVLFSCYWPMLDFLVSIATCLQISCCNCVDASRCHYSVSIHVMDCTEVALSNSLV